MRTYFWQRCLSGGLAIASLSVISPVWAIATTSNELAQSSPLSCTVEQQNLTQSTVFELEEILGQAINRQDYQQAARTLVLILQTLQALDAPLQAAQLTTLLIEGGNQGASYWQQLLNYAVNTPDPEAIAAVLTEAATTVQSLDNQYQ